LKYLPFGEKIVRIGPVDPEIALLNLKKKKLTQAKYIARSAGLSSGLNKQWRPFAEQTGTVQNNQPT